MRDATVVPKIAPSMFPVLLPETKTTELLPTHQPNMSKRRVENAPMQRKKSVASDDFGDADLDDDTLVTASYGELEFNHIDNFADPVDVITRSNTTKNKPAKEKGRSKNLPTASKSLDEPAPCQLPNGRWLCSHKCKDKEACKHYCCKHGMDKPPKKAVPKRSDEHQNQSPLDDALQCKDKTQTTIQLQSWKRKNPAAIEELDLTQQEKKRKTEYAFSGPRDYRALHKLHEDVQKAEMPASLLSVTKKKPAYCYEVGGEHQLSFLSQPATARPTTSSEYGDLQADDFDGSPPAKVRDARDLTSPHFSREAPIASRGSDTFGDDDSVFGEAIVGLADSQDLQANNISASDAQSLDERGIFYTDEDFTDVDFQDLSVKGDPGPGILNRLADARAPFVEATSSPEQCFRFKAANSAVQDGEARDLQQGKAGLPQSLMEEKDEMEDDDVFSDLLDILDLPLANDKENMASSRYRAKAMPQQQSTGAEEEEPQQAPGGFEDLQPWLFEEFGDIVELVDE